MTTFQPCRQVQVGSAFKIEIALVDCNGDPVPITGQPLQVILEAPGGTIHVIQGAEGSSTHILEAQIAAGLINAAGDWRAQAIAHFGTGPINSSVISFNAAHNLFTQVIGDPPAPTILGVRFPQVLAG